MQYDVATPSDYINALEEDWRKPKLLAIRQMILDNGPHLKEDIEYKMLSYQDQTTTNFCLNAQKGYVSLYVGNISKVPDSEELLKEFNMGKGCIRIKKSVAVEGTQLEEFIRRVIKIYREGGEVDC